MTTPIDAVDAFLDATGGQRVRLSLADGVTLAGTLTDVEEVPAEYLGHGGYVEGYRVATLEHEGERYAVEMPLLPDGRPGDIALLDGAATGTGTVDGSGADDAADRTVLGTVVVIESLDGG